MKKMAVTLMAVAAINTASLPADAAQPFTNIHTGSPTVIEANWLQAPAQCLKNPACRKMLLKKLRDLARQLHRAAEILADKAIDLADEVQESVCPEKVNPERPTDAP